MQISDRLTAVPASPIRKLVPHAQSAKNQGVRVYHLNIGDPDVKTPDVMIRKLRNWDTSPIGYDQSQGNPELLDALIGYYRQLGYGFIDSSHILITMGGSEAISMAMFAVCGPDDEIIVFEPFYANYNSYAVVNGIRLVPVPTDIGNGFHLPDAKTIGQAVTSRTKAILICSPNNPTGTVYTRKEMDMLVDLAASRNLYLMSDEVYREFVYDGNAHTSLFKYMEKYPDRLIVLDSLSKRYSFCGGRVGVLVTMNRGISEGVLRIAQGRLSAGYVDQMVAAELRHIPSGYLEGVCKEYRKRRDILYRGLQKISGVEVPQPEGAFYLIAGLPVADAEDFCRWLLTDFRDNGETVMLAPAAGFYATPDLGRNQVRIAYVLDSTKLERSVSIIARALSVYGN